MQLYIFAIAVILLVAVIGFVAISVYNFYAEQRRERLRMLKAQQMIRMEAMAASQAILRAYMKAKRE